MPTTPASQADSEHQPQESYAGPAQIGEVSVTVDLKGYFEAIDGRFHWYGRVAANDALSQSSGDSVTLATPHGTAEAKLSDLDPWGRFRITGTGEPPF